MDGGLSLERLVLEAAEAARPPERLTVSQAAEKYRRLNNPGAYVGPWLNDTAPYLVEPMDVLQSLDFTAMAFAGPAQCGKTDMAMNWIGYSVKCDPADMMIVQTSGPSARDFSIRRIDRLHRHSPDIGAMIAQGQGDNVYDKQYRNGMLLTMSWPSINELSGKPIPRLWLTDYDRMPMNIDDEGAPFDLAQARTRTFRSRGMTAVESSPGFVVEKPNWVRKTRHEAPPTEGILGIYNTGDRRRWYVECVRCHTKFEPTFELIEWPDTEDKMEAAEAATMVCPHCHVHYHHEPHGDLPGKHLLNLGGRWIKDGQTWHRDGSITGNAVRSMTASFWLKGVAAAFSTWAELVTKYLDAEEEYERTNSEEKLKSVTNTALGEPYIPKSYASDRVPEELKSRARDYGEKLVPEDVRFLAASVDVQKNRFVVQVHGYKLDNDIHVIDRFEIKHSKRRDPEKRDQFLWVNPGAHAEDWRLLVEQVMMKSYALDDGSGRRMAVKMTVCDSGGREGVTANAYDFVRWLRRPPEEALEEQEDGEVLYPWEPGLAGRFMLLKGASTKNAPRLAISYPDSQRKDRNAGARGEIPVAIINTNEIKDMLNNRLDRYEPGGRVCFPNWLDDNFYIELTVEVKDPKKGWINPKQYRNESWDLLAYALVVTLLPSIAWEHLDLDELPSWAEVWDDNDLVFDPGEKPVAFQPKKATGLAKLGESLA